MGWRELGDGVKRNFIEKMALEFNLEKRECFARLMGEKDIFRLRDK